VIGVTIESIQVGDSAQLTRRVADRDIAEFVDAVGDYNPVHSDRDYAASTMFKEPIAPGIWTAGLISAVIGTRLPGPGAIYLSQDLKFLKPVKFSDVITARVEVVEVNRERNRIRLRTVCANQRGEEVLTGEALVMPSKTRVDYEETSRQAMGAFALWMLAPWAWAAQGARLSNIIDGCFEETHNVELRMPREVGSEFTPPAQRATRTQFSMSLAPSGDLAAAQGLLERKIVRSSAESSLSSVKETRPVKETRRFFGGFGGNSLSLADGARDLRDWQSAARYYRQALKEKPDHPAIWVQYGHALKESGNRLEAENAYRKSIELDGDVADTHLQLGHVLKIQGRGSEASTAYLRALVLDPQLDDAAFELKRLGWTRGRIELALRRARSGE